MNQLQKVARRIYDHAQRQQMNGAVPTYLGVSGLLALIHKGILDYHDADDQETALYDIASSALHCIALTAEEDEFEELLDESIDEHGNVDNVSMLDEITGEDLGAACDHQGEIEVHDNYFICGKCAEPLRQLTPEEQKGYEASKELEDATKEFLSDLDSVNTETEAP